MATHHRRFGMPPHTVPHHEMKMRKPRSKATRWASGCAWWTVGLVVAALGLGCGDVDEPSLDAGPLPIGPPSGAAFCDTNADCSGGEVCRDTTNGKQCIRACRGDDQCRTDERCVDSACWFWCVDDLECGTQGWCQRDEGRCFRRDCDTDEDCAGGFTCERTGCLPVDPLVCEPGTSTCDEFREAVLTCNAEGSRLLSTACGAGEACTEEQGTAVCVARVCDPGRTACDGPFAEQVCDAFGLTTTRVPCEPGTACLSGNCEPVECAPNSSVCVAHARRACDGEGRAGAIRACSEESTCEGGALGCGCRGGVCVTRVCAPGEGRCVGQGAEICNAEGTAWEPFDTCGGSTRCVGGVCVTRPCESGQSICAGTRRLLTCDDAGDWVERDCTQRDQVCSDARSAPACVPRLCTPDSVVCSVDRTQIDICVGAGASVTSIRCADDQRCEEGACVARR